MTRDPGNADEDAPHLRDAVLRPESDQVRADRRRRIGGSRPVESAEDIAEWNTPAFRAALEAKRRAGQDAAMSCLVDPAQPLEARHAAAAKLSGPMTADDENRVLALLCGPQPTSRAERLLRMKLMSSLVNHGCTRSFVLNMPSYGGAVRRSSWRDTDRVGHLGGGYGWSIYDFHKEYPIDGTGTPKHEILVQTPAGEVDIVTFCQEQQVIVLCSRCQRNITGVDAPCPRIIAPRQT